MKITLIEPQAPGKHVFSSVKMPRLGLPILGTILKKEGHQVKLIFASHSKIKLFQLRDCDLLAISTITSTAPAAYYLGDLAREQGIPVVMGGPHVTFLAEEALAHCDYVCRGEGDVTFLQLVNCIERGEIPREVPGISYRLGEEIIHNPSPDWVDINQVPIPDFNLLEELGLSTYPVMASRGCPYDCTFCSVTPMFGHKFRCRSQASLLEELKEYRGRKVFFVDDNFTASPRRTRELLQQMLQEKLTPRWWCAQVRTDAARDEELLRLMRNSGCGMVFVGMESINPATLENYNKHQEVSDIEHCIRQFHRYGMMVHGMFVFGSENDTVQTIRDTLDFALKNRIDTVQFLILTPLPGTRVYQEMEAAGQIFTHDWELYDAHHVVYHPQLLSAEELQVETMQAFRRFYSLRHLFANLFVTGFRSVAFRAVGFWIMRKWERDNRWFYRFLRHGFKGDSSSSSPRRPKWTRPTRNYGVVGE